MRLDRDLIQGILEREDSAWDELHARYGKKLRRHLLRTVRDEAAAEDLLQEVLLRVWPPPRSAMVDWSSSTNGRKGAWSRHRR